MKFGVNLINFGPGANPESLTRSVNLVEAIGYHLIMSSDHIAVTPDVSSRYPAPFYEPLTTMGWLAATTQSMEIGTTVAILPYRSPLEIARAGANVDQLSGGRFILGVGVGWAEQGFDALNVPFRQRGAITDDYLAAIKALWTQDVASYEGRFVSFTDVDTAARPVREPHPPIWAGVQATVHSAGRCATETAGTRSGYACPISRTGRFLACARWRTASRCLYPRSARGYACASPSRPCPTTSVSSAKAASTRSGPRLHPRPARHLLLRRRGHNPPRDRMENARDSRRKGRRPEKRNGAVTSNINTIR